MDAEGLKELFEPFAAVSTKRMFSGYGIYAEGVCFALNLRGEVYLKVDSETETRFEAAGAEPFVYGGHRGQVVVMSYRRLLASAYDDPDELRAWCRLAMEAARRAAEVKNAKAAARIAKKTKSAKAKAPAKSAPRVKQAAKGRAH